MPDIPAPLDAYPTAKPGEPTFTLQGGDVLAEHLVRLWVWGARGMAGVCKPSSIMDHASAQRFIDAVVTNRYKIGDKESEALLLRATAAEEVAWDMRAYREGKGSAGAVEAKPAGENSADEKARLDLHDVRVRYAQQLSSMFSTLTDMRQDLLTRGGFFCGEHDPLDNVWLSAILQLKEMSRLVEPRRLMQQSG